MKVYHSWDPGILEAARAEIEDGSPERRNRLAGLWIARITGLREPLVEKMRAVAAEFRKGKEAVTGEFLPEDTVPYAEQEDEEKHRQLRLAAFAALMVELLLAVYASITYLLFYWLLGAAVGVLFSIALAIQVKGVLAPSFDPQLPNRSLRGLTRWIRVSFAISFVGIAVLLLARANPWAGPLADVSLAVLNASLPILAGSLFILSSVYGRFGRLERLYDRLRVQAIELDQLLDQLRLHVRKERSS